MLALSSIAISSPLFLRFALKGSIGAEAWHHPLARALLCVTHTYTHTLEKRIDSLQPPRTLKTATTKRESALAATPVGHMSDYDGCMMFSSGWEDWPALLHSLVLRGAAPVPSHFASTSVFSRSPSSISASSHIFHTRRIESEKN